MLKLVKTLTIMMKVIRMKTTRMNRSRKKIIIGLTIGFRSKTFKMGVEVCKISYFH
jgi:hypothetical protein